LKIKINAVEFDIEPVPAVMRQAILSDPILSRGVWREVWQWDAVAQQGKPLAAMTDKRAVPLGNGIAFFVPRIGAQGEMMKSEAPSKKMAERVMKATGAKTLLDLMNALNRIINLPQKELPLGSFAPLNPVASFKIGMYVDYNVVQMANAARNLSAYLLIPGQVAFQHHVTAIPDQVAYDAVLAATPGLATLQPAFVVPPRTKANLGLRSLAVGRALADLQDEIRAAGGPEAASDAQKRRAAQLATEWRVLRSTEAAEQQPRANGLAPAAAIRRA